MTSIFLKSGIVLALAALTATGALADSRRGGTEGGSSYWSFGWGRGTATPAIDREQAAQADAIERGVRDGSLTRRETSRLRDEQAHIAEMERRAKFDGVVTAVERKRILDALEVSNTHIQEASNDGERDVTTRRAYNRWKRYVGN